ncbi:CPBP family intramembrane glutamic endopeptidase [Acidicapsa acidisoli]|uniref:CPBP family intramembrane glutamic endopeptidase n=1 Tax=Acidicapsa acidisoli TaxID=1615681 RepID=UPI0021E0E16E|nr:CPBP family intramembrane glutamic endopeptidase [Acidicapsa acidisoli]
MNDGVIGEGEVAGRLNPVPAPAEEMGIEIASETVDGDLRREPSLEAELMPVEGSRSAVQFEGPPVFTNGFPYLVPEPLVARTPNFADACLFLVLMLLGLLITTGLVGLALHYHWLGLRSFEEASKSTPVALGTQLLVYLIALTGAVPFFRTVWARGYFDGLHWHAATASHLRYRLVATAFLCNVLAMVGNWLLPFPQHAPIDKLFGSSRDAWMLACFGVTIAPFFEEMIFRGFLLPAVATAWDWCSERMTGRRPRRPDSEGNPVWSVGAMIFGALIVSAPFALMHSAQVGDSWGPLLLLYSVSLILCAVRLGTRSLAASTLVHSAYNCMLFTVMLVETDGFRHMDKL